MHMRARQFAGAADAIAAERCSSSLREPMLRRHDAIDDVERDRLVVSLQRNDLFRQPSLQIDNVADNTGALRPRSM
jgi:hypothetical protein